MASPPAIQTTSSNPCSDACAACGLVALESSTQRTPSISATSAMRWASGLNARRPSRTARGSTPVSYTHLTLPTKSDECRARRWPSH
ncbi:hypothetical protein [Aeromicrobium fastidiosum]|uniref:hypothetical protein n=1 Tax=Aeromicrobium fastidiosum TaxID=52699 RepID=UPI0027E17FEF|nr:hypothetical protein [Aeromicrobium fastidiosum]